MSCVCRVDVRQRWELSQGQWLFFFFRQKTAYEMRISDWSSDVCSSDLQEVAMDQHRVPPVIGQIESELGQLHRFRNVDRRQHDVPVIAMPAAAGRLEIEIGRASCRERVCQYV